VLPFLTLALLIELVPFIALLKRSKIDLFLQLCGKIALKKENESILKQIL
jgi:hypothetical protein